MALRFRISLRPNICVLYKTQKLTIFSGKRFAPFSFDRVPVFGQSVFAPTSPPLHRVHNPNDVILPVTDPEFDYSPHRPLRTCCRIGVFIEKYFWAELHINRITVFIVFSQQIKYRGLTIISWYFLFLVTRQIFPRETIIDLLYCLTDFCWQTKKIAFELWV